MEQRRAHEEHKYSQTHLGGVCREKGQRRVRGQTSVSWLLTGEAEPQKWLLGDMKEFLLLFVVGVGLWKTSLSAINVYCSMTGEVCEFALIYSSKNKYMQINTS